MIHGIYGLAHVGLSHFNSYCKHEKIQYAVANPNGLEKMQTGEEISPFPVVILTVVNFLKIHQRFKKKPVCIFIIDNPVQLESLDVPIVGCTKQISYHYQFHPIKASDIRLAIETCDDKPIEFKLKKTKVIADLMRAAAAESIMSPLQTAFYQIKATDIRVEVQDVVFDFLSGKANDKKLKSKLKIVSSDTIRNKLEEILASEPFERLRKAATLILSGELKYETASTKYKVPVYDLKYVAKKAAAKMNIEIPG